MKSCSIYFLVAHCIFDAVKENGFYIPIHILEIIEQVKYFKTFVFAEGDGINYKAGQYLSFVRYADGEEMRRSYFITSSPILDEALSIGVKRVENGFFSRLLADTAVAGNELITIGAGGLFVLAGEV